MLLVMLSACILPNVLYRHDQLELTAASQAHEQSEDGISDESGTDSEDKSLLRRRTMRRSKRTRTLGEQTVRRDNIISFSTIGSMYV
jgi:hypothetical protein